jgi:hypothetical protein
LGQIIGMSATALCSAVACAAPDARASYCRNCSAPVSANYCPDCGQTTSLHPPSVWEFAHELVSHYIRRMYYGEHLVFALHVHSFWFFLALAMTLLPDVIGQWLALGLAHWRASRELQLILPSVFVRRDHHAHVGRLHSAEPAIFPRQAALTTSVLHESNTEHRRISGVFRAE